MKIKQVEPIVLYAQDTTTGFTDKPNVGGYTGYQVVVRVETDDGVVGWGECCTGSDNGEAAHAVKLLIDKGLSSRIIGQNPSDYRKLWERLYSAVEWYGRRGLGIFALSGIDTALMDVVGRAHGIPTYELLGGCFRDEIPLYASLLFDMEDPEGTAKKGQRYIRDGYVGVKFGWGMVPSKPFGVDQDEDEAMVATIRNVLGPRAWLMIDVGRYVNWTRSYAIQMAKRLEKYGIFWLEEALPQDDVQGFVELARSVDVTIAAGEGYQTLHDFNDLLSRGALDLIQPDVSKAGGLSETKRIVELARAYNLRWVPHNWSTAINTAASLQLVASAPDAFLLEFKQEPNPLVHELSKSKFSVSNGKLKVPSTPGLGIEIDEDVVTKYRVK